MAAAVGPKSIFLRSSRTIARVLFLIRLGVLSYKTKKGAKSLDVFSKRVPLGKISHKSIWFPWCLPTSNRIHPSCPSAAEHGITSKRKMLLP